MSQSGELASRVWYVFVVDTKIIEIKLNFIVPYDLNFSLQCFDTVGWATGRISGL